MSAEPARRHARLVRLEALKARRLRTAEEALAAARREVEHRLAALRDAEATLAGIEAALAELQAWFQAPDPRHIPAALARRDALGRDRAEADATRLAAIEALDAAQAVRIEAAAHVARARARRDLAAEQVAGAARRVRRIAEQAAEIEQEERSRPAPTFAALVQA